MRQTVQKDRLRTLRKISGIWNFWEFFENVSVHAAPSGHFAESYILLLKIEY